jgi:hypothetical protein
MVLQNNRKNNEKYNIKKAEKFLHFQDNFYIILNRFWFWFVSVFGSYLNQIREDFLLPFTMWVLCD